MKTNVELKEDSQSGANSLVYEKNREFGDGLVVIHGTRIRFFDFSAREDGDAIRTFDLNDYWLPATPFRPAPTRVGAHPALVRGLGMAMLELGRRISPVSKDGHKRIAAALNTLTKFIEYGWINGYYSFEDWNIATAKNLAIAFEAQPHR